MFISDTAFSKAPFILSQLGSILSKILESPSIVYEVPSFREFCSLTA
uniref:Uncharacterized protein n=1 Tax=Podoviridae sp. ct8Lf7 TaxID=2827723 RepID=A0A8S5S1G5_9CAUD|nr:MAG TPA: hypothetical protein [Podoviridae sp. ct8Lf7]